ncbi:MAG: hypothetical protein WCL32_03265 [Planctomycetota bacterium]|jgi:hypothetical protein
MSVDLGRTSIFKEFETLRRSWAESEAIWKDTVRLEFTKDKWHPLETSVLTCLSALDRIAPVLVQVREDCSSRSQY